jgi:hypothetical protein
MTLATIFLCHTFKGDFDVLTTPRPAWFSAFTTSCSTAHFFLL